MSDTPTRRDDDIDACRMLLEPDSIHESDGGLYLDCPQCGSNVSFEQVVNDGQCTGKLDNEVAETADDTRLQSEHCTAELSLEFVWEA